MPRRRHWFFGLAAGLMVSMTLAACGGAGAGTGAATTSASAAATATAATQSTTVATSNTLSGAFDEGPGGCPECFNPLTATAGFTWLEEYYQPLVLYDVNFQKIQGVLATSWSVSQNGLAYTFHLRKGVQWQDGKPFTSADVKFTIGLVQNPASASWIASYFTDVTGVTTPNADTAVIHLKSPDAALLSALTFLVMLPQHALSSIPPAQLVKSSWWRTDPIGTGPFKWEKYVPSQYVELAANPTYWGGKPKLAHLIDRYYKQSGAAVLALQSGQIQFTYINPDVVSTLKSNPNIQILSGPSQVINYLGFNLHSPLWKDVRVREAVMYAINRQQIVQKLFNNGAVEVSCPYNNPQYIPQNLNTYPYDPAKAKQLLKAAGWSQTQPIQTLTYYTDQLSTNVLTTMQQMLGAVGINITPRAVDVPTYRSILGTGKWSLMYAGAANGPDPSVVSTYFTSNAQPPAGANYYGLNNSTVDHLFAEGLSAGQSQRAGVYQQVCTALNQQLPWAPLWVTTRYGAVSTAVKGFIWTPSPGGGHYVQDAQNWSLAAK